MNGRERERYSNYMQICENFNVLKWQAINSELCALEIFEFTKKWVGNISTQKERAVIHNRKTDRQEMPTVKTLHFRLNF